MSKNIEELKAKIKFLYNIDIETAVLNDVFGYTNNYQLLADILDLILYDLLTITRRSKKGNYRYMLLLMPCIEKQIYLNDISETSPLYIKMELIIQTIDQLLERKYNSDLNSHLLKIRSHVEKILNIINSTSYKDRRIIELKQKEALLVKNEKAKAITDYILFEIKDIHMITKLDDLIFINAIKNNINDFIDKLCYEYFKQPDNEYYYLLFAYLSSNPSFDLKSKYDYILEKFKDYLNKVYKTDINIEDFSKDVGSLDRVLKIIKDKSSMKKYGIKEFDDSSYLCNINMSNKEVLDLRDKRVFTIDSMHSECLDDALSFEKLENGNYLISVYITDISDIVTPDGDIDRYAYNLGETIYHSKNIPMLPKELYNIKCSLNTIEDKYVHVYSFEVDEEFNIIKFMMNKAIIRVSMNYTYQRIDDLILNGDTPFSDELRQLYEFTLYLMKKNSRRQLYIENKEILDPLRRTIDRYGKNPSNRIISELKVLVNSYIAKEASKMDIPFIYRNNFKREIILPNGIKQILKDSEFNQIKSYLCSSFGGSSYSDKNYGHYGLDLDTYAHATTPLRCYSSLFNQRIISNYIIEKDSSYSSDLYMVTKDLAEHLNERVILNKLYKDEAAHKKKMLTKQV